MEHLYRRRPSVCRSEINDGDDDGCFVPARAKTSAEAEGKAAGSRS